MMNRLRTAFGLFFKDYCGESKYGSESCGEVMNSRILGGRNARKFEFPWQVLLAICNQTICTECSGSIINKKDVLTAAHCFNIPNIRYIKVSVALLDRRWLTRYTRHYRSSKYVIHEKYDPYTLMNDIAIVHVPVKIRFNPGVQSICLPNKIMSSSFNGKNCNREGVDACQGDSGGPLITQVNGKCSLIGVISGGVGCGRIGFAGLYTRVTEYVDWISEKGKELDEESEESLMEPLISVMVHLKDLFFRQIFMINTFHMAKKKKTKKQLSFM
ncbi:unnamed protein product [Lepeophtheirus salmonis]|uniref:(salmon louse) hypothetical protein n=1 Tax=Lepeophtheirus salmonis TaxID=72036 RepID=A0A7R8CC42_LEPSM|nr:unnamed protein product [Lepeophtheirus salmonis]CAF2765479.1 unnamed protein product [Lepeophtheirus salmonis]